MIALIEIILRKDLQEYEARPLFGLTYRQVATAALITAVSVAVGVGMSSLGISGTPMLVAVCTLGAGIGFVGLGRIHGLKPEQWYRIWKADRAWPATVVFAPPVLSPAADRKSAKASLSRSDRRQAKADQAEALSESEIFF